MSKVPILSVKTRTIRQRSQDLAPSGRKRKIVSSSAAGSVVAAGGETDRTRTMKKKMT